jgi:hypothetical protein
MLISDSGGKLFRDASRQFNDCGKKLDQPLNRFRKARTAMLESTSLPDLEAHYMEAAAHLKVVADNLDEYLKLADSLDVDALFTLARQSEDYRGLTDEELKAGVEKRVVKVLRIITKHVEYCSVVYRKKELDERAAAGMDHFRRASGNEQYTRSESQ